MLRFCIYLCRFYSTEKLYCLSLRVPAIFSAIYHCRLRYIISSPQVAVYWQKANPKQETELPSAPSRALI